ncbi:MAPEG family protein [Glaciecola sp. 2405UD65-10]|uniref:MAPEG family protein n=1 Tax=Glaciecola sp. 2405UD65-10 TaxID=3397244 RepID=UPI003B599A21
MFIIIICMAAVVFMPILAKIPLAIQMNKAGGYDNKHPRTQQSKLTGLGARAQAAHENCYEAICYFAPTVLLVLALDEHNVYTAQLCMAFVAARLSYIGFYLANWDIARSLAWAIGMGTLIAHYWMLLA